MTFPSYPGNALRIGSTGNNVLIMQDCLNFVIEIYPFYKKISSDGIYGKETSEAVSEFQGMVGLTQDGVIGNKTWNAILTISNFFSYS